MYKFFKPLPRGKKRPPWANVQANRANNTNKNFILKLRQNETQSFVATSRDCVFGGISWVGSNREKKRILFDCCASLKIEMADDNSDKEEDEQFSSLRSLRQISTGGKKKEKKSKVDLKET